MPTTAKGIHYPAAADPDDVPADLQAIADWMDARPGVSAVTTTQRNALTGVDLWNGRVVLNTTTQQLEQYNSATTSWVPAAVAGAVLGHAEASAATGFQNTGAWVDDTVTVAFTAPVSGAVALDVRVNTQINGGNSDAAARVGYHITGPTTVTADDSRSVLFEVTDSGGTQRKPMVAWRFFPTGLTPGGAYTVKLALKGSGGWFAEARQLSVDAA